MLGNPLMQDGTLLVERINRQTQRGEGTHDNFPPLLNLASRPFPYIPKLQDQCSREFEVIERLYFKA